MLRIVVERAGDLLFDEVFRKPLISIGRDPDGDIVLDDATVSGLHLVIKADPQRNGFRFFGQGWNGTLQNGQKVQHGRFDDVAILQIADYDLTLIPVKRTGTEEVELFDAAKPTRIRETNVEMATMVDAQAPPPAPAVLRSLSGDCDPAIVTLTKRILIGRSSDCDVRSARANVSRHHCEVYPVQHGFAIKRLSSRNGVEINGRRLANLEERQLASGDVISFSGQQLIFILPGREISSDRTLVGEASPNTDSTAASGKDSS